MPVAHCNCEIFLVIYVVENVVSFNHMGFVRSVSLVVVWQRQNLLQQFILLYKSQTLSLDSDHSTDKDRGVLVFLTGGLLQIEKLCNY